MATVAPARRARALTAAPAPVDPLALLPSVELGPPETTAPKAGSLGGRAALAVGFLAGSLVLVVAILAALIGLNVLAMRSGRIIGALVVATIAVVAAFGQALRSLLRKPADNPFELEVSETDEPGLWAEVRALADVVGTRAPDRVVLITEVNAYVHERAGFLGLVGGRRTLAIGTPLLELLTVSQLRAVLGHELGHFAGGDTRLGPLAWRTEMVLHTVIRSLGNRGTALIFEWYYRLYHRITATVRRGQEVVADRASVRVAGRQASADALQRLEVAGLLHDRFVHAYVVPMVEAGTIPQGIGSGFRNLVHEPEVVEAAIAGRDDSPAPVDPYATHPPTPERIRRVTALAEDVEVAPDDRPATSLLHAADTRIDAAWHRWAQLVTGGRELPTSSWDEFGATVTAPWLDSVARDVDRALGELGLPPGVDGVRAAVEAGRENDLVARLIGLGWRHTGSDRSPILRLAVQGVAGRILGRSTAHSWRLSWSGPIELRTKRGRIVDLGELSSRAVDGDWAPLLKAVAGATSDPLATHVEDTPQHGSGLPAAPVPPFTGDANTGWRIELPTHLGSSKELHLDADGVSWAGRTVDWTAVEGAKISFPAAQAGVSLAVEIRTADGPLKLRANATGQRASSAVLMAAEQLWASLRVVSGPRLRAGLVDQIDGGGSVDVGGYRLTRAGVATVKRPTDVARWADVSDPVVQDQKLWIPRSSGKPFQAPTDRPDAFLLPDLLPELRARYG